MTIKILDSWLRDYLKTEAKPGVIAEKLSLSSVSIERVEKYNNDYLYEIEITTNRPDLASVVGLAREATTVLKHAGVNAKFLPPRFSELKKGNSSLIEIKNDPKLVNRVCAAVLNVNLKPSPKYLQERLEASGTRSLNNVIDITNYVMKTIGHPTHVFDFDRLNSKTLTIREAKTGEKITTLDDKQYLLRGGEIVAVDDRGEIVDLLGVMGLKNSTVTDKTERILYFINNNEPYHIRKTSMSLGIRTEAATLNEKGLDPKLAHDSLLYGIKLFEDVAGGKLISNLIDIYPNKPKEKTIKVTKEKINTIVGVPITLTKASQILTDLELENKTEKDYLIVKVPTFRINDIEIEEDIIEEIARIYGYQNIPNQLITFASPLHSNNEFYWEKRIKEALKYWGFTEVYTYSMVSEDLLEGPTTDAVQISNPLSEEFVYMRRTLVPSLLKVVSENITYEDLKIFEISNVYEKKENDLPIETLMLSGVVKKPKLSFFEVKGIIEQLLFDLGIKNLIFKNSQRGGLGATVYIDKEYLGEIEVLDKNTIDFELNFKEILKHVSFKREYKPLSKYPPVVEDLSIIVSDEIQTQDLISEIKKQTSLIVKVELFDSYQDSRTFHIVYQDKSKNLTLEDVKDIREKTIQVLKNKFKAKIKE